MKGIYAVDRGGDWGKLYNKFLERKKEKRFVIRLTKTRGLVHKGVNKNCHEMASALPCPHEAIIVRYEDGKERKITIAYNALPVKLPKHAYPLFLFAVIYLGNKLKLKVLVKRIYLVSKRFFGVPTFFNYAMADGLYNLLFPDRTEINGSTQKAKRPEFQLTLTDIQLLG
jgi:hypothetical protein